MGRGGVVVGGWVKRSGGRVPPCREERRAHILCLEMDMLLTRIAKSTTTPLKAARPGSA